MTASRTAESPQCLHMAFCLFAIYRNKSSSRESSVRLFVMTMHPIEDAIYDSFLVKNIRRIVGYLMHAHPQRQKNENLAAL